MLDKFYTKDSVVQRCLAQLESYVKLETYVQIIEPSCGDGAFVKRLPKSNLVYMDVAPEIDGAVSQNFYDYTTDLSAIVVGNPPFGRNGSEAVKFFNHAATFADVIAFIVPRTFKRVSVQNRLNRGYHLLFQDDIPIGSFIPESMKAKCVFQIWKRKDYEREVITLPSFHTDIQFVNKGEASIALKAYGGTGDCGTVLKEFQDVNPKAYHFIKCNKSTEDILQKLNYYPLAGDTVRQDSIGRKDLIYLYENYLKNMEN